jgi:hypothetical protein
MLSSSSDDIRPLWRYSLTYLLTPWCRILFEKLIVTQLIKKILLSLWNPKVHRRVHKIPPMDPILSQLNPVRPIDPYLPKVQLNVILPPTPRSSQWSLTFGPPNQNPTPVENVFSKYDGVYKSFRTESITKYMLTTINTRLEGTQSVVAAKLTRLTHKIAIKLHLVAESFTTCSSRSRWSVRKLLDTPS